jgi:hypothetical protein
VYSGAVTPPKHRNPHVTANIELYFRLNITERRIVRTVARMGLTPSTLSVFQLYFPKVAADDLRWLIAEILKFPDE